MLTVDLISVRRHKGELSLPAFDAKARRRAMAFAEEIIAMAGEALGLPRAEFEALWGELGQTQSERRLVRGLAKLFEDDCSFEEADPERAQSLRSALFLRASEVRRNLDAGQPFPREAVLAQVAQELGAELPSVDELLFADLPGAQRLLSVPSMDAATLVERYGLSRVQAVLLRAKEVRLSLIPGTAVVMRRVFSALKFRRLLYRVLAAEEGRISLILDGPHSLFEGTTKYGVQLAMLFPRLLECESFELDADVCFKPGKPEHFRFEYRRPRRASLAMVSEAEELTDEVRDLVSGLRDITTSWTVEPAHEFLVVSGSGVCIPDITLSEESTGRRVHVEVLGYWSRDAVWKRVELAESGLPEPVVFAVSHKLRVSKEVLDETLPASLYVFKGRINPKSLFTHVLSLVNKAKVSARSELDLSRQSK